MSWVDSGGARGGARTGLMSRANVYARSTTTHFRAFFVCIFGSLARWSFVASLSPLTGRLYDINDRNNNNPIATLENPGANITAVAFHCEGKWLATGSDDGSIKIWDTRTSAIQRDYSHGSPVNDVVVHPNQGELISCDQNGSVKIWDLGENSCTHELVPCEDVPIRSVSIASDGGTLVAGNDKVSRLFSVVVSVCLSRDPAS